MKTASTRKGLILALTCAAQFMVVLDIAIVNVALPAIQLDLGIGQNALQWVVIAYGLLLGGFLLLGGRLGDLLGRRPDLPRRTGPVLGGVADGRARRVRRGAHHGQSVPRVRRRTDRPLRAVDPRRHLHRGTRTELGARDLRRGGRNLRLRRRHRQRPADRRSRVAMDLLHQPADRRPADLAGGQVPARRSAHNPLAPVRRPRCHDSDRGAAPPRLRAQPGR